MAWSVWPIFRACVPLRNASSGEMPLLGELPSNPPAGPTPTRNPAAKTLTRALDIRISFFLALGTGMRHCAMQRRAHLLGVLPQGPRARVILPRLPLAPAHRQFLVGQAYIEGAAFGIELDDVTVAQKTD